MFVNTNDPVIGGGLDGYAQANYGNYNDLGGQVAVNLPVSDTFAMRIAGYGERRDGFYHITGPGGAHYTGHNGDLRMYAGRLSLLWKPSDNFSVLSKTDLGYLNFGAYPSSPYWESFKTLPSGAANPQYHDLFHISANAPMSARDKFVRSILKLEYATDSGVKFRSISSYQKGSTRYGTDLDGTSSDFTNPLTGLPMPNQSFYDIVNERQLAQEFNIISPDKQRFTWLLGAFGLWNKYTFPAPYDNFDINLCYPYTAAVFPACHYQLKGINPERSLALFGQVGFNLTDALKLEVGGRYTDSRTTNHVDVMQYGTLHPRRSGDQIGQFLLQGVARLAGKPRPVSLRFRRDRLPAGRPQRAGRPRQPRPVRAREGHLVRGGLEGQLRRRPRPHDGRRLL